MRTISEIRRANLRALLGEYRRDRVFAKKSGLAPAFVSQIKTGHRNMGSSVARAIEAKLNLETGYLDRIHTQSDPDSSGDGQLGRFIRQTSETREGSSDLPTQQASSTPETAHTLEDDRGKQQRSERFQVPFNHDSNRSTSASNPFPRWSSNEIENPDQAKASPVDGTCWPGVDPFLFSYTAQESPALEKGDAPPLAFTYAWLRELGRLKEPGDNQIIVEAEDDAMEPEIRRGDFVLMDTDATEVVEGNVYVINYRERFRVRRLSIRYDGSLIIRSDNSSKYPEEVVPSLYIGDQVYVVGRVIWRAGKLE